jgi:hypothetical protein
MTWLIVGWIGSALLLTGISWLFDQGWLSVGIRHKNDQWMLELGRYAVLIADPDGAYDPMYDVFWRGILICKKTKASSGRILEILRRISYSAETREFIRA